MSKYVYKRQHLTEDDLLQEHGENLVCDELASAIRSARANGATEQEIQQALQAATYGLFYGQSPW